MKLKDRAFIHVMVVDGKMVEACQLEGCQKPATQMHGPPTDLIYTCDEHAEEVMLELLNLIVDEDAN
jgi:hypothetical protein